MLKDFLVLLLLHILALTESTPSFKIDVLYKPDSCDRQSNYGDQMFVHFVGRKSDTGEIFDQRFVIAQNLTKKKY